MSSNKHFPVVKSTLIGKLSYPITGKWEHGIVYLYRLNSGKFYTTSFASEGWVNSQLARESSAGFSNATRRRLRGLFISFGDSCVLRFSIE